MNESAAIEVSTYLSPFRPIMDVMAVAPFECERCGDIHPKGCRGHVERCAACASRVTVQMEGVCADCGCAEILRMSPCRRAPMVGGVVCFSHGGAAGHIAAAAETRLATAEMERQAVKFGAPFDIDPRDALAGLVARLQGRLEWLDGELQRLDDFALPQDARGRALARLWEKTVAMLGELSAVAHRAGVADRAVALEADRVKVMAGAILLALDDPEWGLSHELRARGRAVIAEHLRALSAGSTEEVEG
jgi:hypothetical protein